MSDGTHYELQVDMILCDAYGYCAELLPDVIERDEWGYPIVTELIDETRLANARRVVGECPKLALRLTKAARVSRVSP